MELKTIKTILVLPFALTVGAMFAVLGFVASIPLFSLMTVPDTSVAAGLGALGWVIPIMVIYPTILFAISFIASGIMAVVCNFIAPHAGGIKLEVEQVRTIKFMGTKSYILLNRQMTSSEAK